MLPPSVQLVDEEFDALEGFFYVLEHGILQLLENVETYLLHLKVTINTVCLLHLQVRCVYSLSIYS